MTPRTITGALAAAYSVAILVLDLNTNPVALVGGLLLIAAFIAADGWQARREREADRAEVARMCQREALRTSRTEER
jgi:hypothetical protein